MADRACDGLAGATVLHEDLAFFETARWHIGCEAGMRIAFSHSRLILGKRDDAIADRLHSPARLRETHASAPDERLRDHGGFNDFRPRARLQCGEPFARLPDFVIR